MTTTDAEPLAALVDRLRTERDGLREAMRSRAVIEQAKGVLMARHRIDGDAAFARLRVESQRRNVRLAEVAAGVVAGTCPDSGAQTVAPPAVPAATPGDSDDVRARFLLAAARTEAARDAQEIVAALDGSRLDWPAPTSVVLTLVEPDGALRLVAWRGLTAETASQWTRIPPQVQVPLTGAAQTGAPVLLCDPGDIREAYPLVEAIARTGAMAAVPVTRGGRLLGVLGLAWREPLDLAGPRRQRLLGLADAAARALGRAAESSPAGGWLQALLDGSLTPAAVLAPTPDGTDFVFEALNEAASATAARYGTRLAGATLLTASPDLGARELVRLYREVLADGRPRQLDDVPVAAPGGAGIEYRTDRATRLGDRIFATWRGRPAADLAYDDLVAAGRLSRAATFRWHRPSGTLHGTPNLRAVLGWTPAAAPTPATVRRVVDPTQWPAVRAAVAAALGDGVPLDVIVLTRAGRRRLRIRAERVTDAGGRPVALRGAVQVLGPATASRGRRTS